MRRKLCEIPKPSFKPTSFLQRGMYVGFRKQLCFIKAIFCITVSSRGCYILFKSPHEILIQYKIETVVFPPTTCILQGKKIKNKGLRKSVDYSKGNILRADELVWNTMTKKIQGRNLAIVRPCLQKPIITVVCICISQITREDTRITLQKTVKLIIHFWNKLLNAKNSLHSSEVISLLIWSW